MALGSGFGAHITCPDGDRIHGWAFGENQARYVVATIREGELRAAARAAEVKISEIGIVTRQEELKFGPNDVIQMDELLADFENCIPNLMAG